MYIVKVRLFECNAYVIINNMSGAQIDSLVAVALGYFSRKTNTYTTMIIMIIIRRD